MSGETKTDPLTVRVAPGFWCPLSASLAAQLLGRPVENVVAEFGEEVLIRQTASGYEARRMPPAPDSPETRAEVAEIIANARRTHTAIILGRMRLGELSEAGARSALQALGYNKPNATSLTNMATRLRTAGPL